MPKFGMKVPRLIRDSHTSFKVKRSKVRVTDGRGHTVSAELLVYFLFASAAEVAPWQHPSPSLAAVETARHRIDDEIAGRRSIDQRMLIQRFIHALSVS